VLKGISFTRGHTEVEAALDKFNALEQSFEVLKKNAASTDKLMPVLNRYGGALRQWKNGLTLLKEHNADRQSIQKTFELGDQLRAEVCQEFDRRYASKKARSEI
jgi:hypothetical protein